MKTKTTLTEAEKIAASIARFLGEQEVRRRTPAMLAKDRLLRMKQRKEDTIRFASGLPLK